MSLFVVDPEKCNHDSRCVCECPLGIIVLDERTALVPVGGDKLSLLMAW